MAVKLTTPRLVVHRLPPDRATKNGLNHSVGINLPAILDHATLQGYAVIPPSTAIT